MSQEVSFSKISLSKTKAILGLPTDIGKEQDSYDDDDDEDEDPESPSKGDHSFARGHQRRRSSSLTRFEDDRKMLLDQTSTFRDFERLFTALDALEEWKVLAKEGKQ